MSIGPLQFHANLLLLREQPHSFTCKEIVDNTNKKFQISAFPNKISYYSSIKA